MPEPFPTASLAALGFSPDPKSWKENILLDPTIRTKTASGIVKTRARFTATLKRFDFNYRWLTDAAKELIEDHQTHVVVGASKFTFRMKQDDTDWEVRLLKPIPFNVEPKFISRYSASISFFGKQVSKMRTSEVFVEDLAAGADIANRPIFVNPEAVTINSIGILTQGTPAGVDNSNTSIIYIEDDASNALVTKTYNTATQPPSSDYGDLGTLSNNSLNAGEHLMLTVLNGATANLPAFQLIIEWYYT